VTASPARDPHSPRSPLEAVPLDDLRRRTSVKWRAYPQQVLPLFVAEMDVVPPDCVVRAVSDAMASGDTGYDHGTHLAEAFAAFADARWGWQVDPARTRTVPDVMGGIVEALRLVTEPGDAVVITPPVYPPFVSFVEHAGRRVETAPLGEDHRLDLDALDEAFARARTGGRRAAFLLCNPHNPTGTAPTLAELEVVGSLADRHGVRVVSDEIHAPVTVPLDGGPAAASTSVFTSAVTVIPDAIALVSAAKAFHLAGVNAALAVPGPGAVADLRAMPEIVGHGVSHLGALAHAAAFRDGSGWLDAVLEGLARNAHLLAGLLAERLPAARYTPGEATYFAWVDLRALPSVRASAGAVADGAARVGTTGDVTAGGRTDPAWQLLKRGDLAVNSGPTFGQGGAGHVRLNLATSPDVLREAVDRMVAVLG